nr:XdhC/CoxI family protein [Puniceibacterium sediminis]
MTPLEDEMTRLAEGLRAAGTPFAVATVVRTVGATAAKPGARALIHSDGTIGGGWIGGGCVRSALARAAQEALADGQPKFLSLMPEDLLQGRGVTAGSDVEGVRFARNGCPSKGSMDVFVEPHLPQPELVVLGASPVAVALVRLAAGFGFRLNAMPLAEPLEPVSAGAQRLVVVATQGKGDLDGLRMALASGAIFLAFVGSRRKFAALSEKLAAEGIAARDLARVQAPAGLDIHALTPEEIALSILAQVVQVRRSGQRHAD